MDCAAHPPAKFPAWLVANGVVVTLMVAVVALIWTAESEVWSWLPKGSWEVVFWVALVGGPIGLALCCAAIYMIDAQIEDRQLRFIFVGMNLVGILIGLSSFVLWFFWLILRNHPRC